MNHERHLGIYTIPPLTRFDLIGCGGIGSITAVTLAKMGVRYLDLHDSDKVEPVNIATQLHPVSGVGNYKVDSVASLCSMFSDDVEITEHRDNVSEQTTLNGNIVISAVDSINARKAIWEAVLASHCMWYIDARMSAEVFQMYVVHMDDLGAVKRYGGQLRATNEEDVPDIVCTMKATFFCAAISAGQIGAAIKKIFTGSLQSYRLVHYIAKNSLIEVNV